MVISQSHVIQLLISVYIYIYIHTHTHTHTHTFIGLLSNKDGSKNKKHYKFFQGQKLNRLL